jgi:hypothetical protein
MTSSILDTDNRPRQYAVVFHSVKREGWFWRMLKPGFQHVQIWLSLTEGQWVQLDGCLEGLFVTPRETAPWFEVEADEGVTILTVQRPPLPAKVREPFHIGPITCVDLAKAVLGIRAPFVRTPYQLYKYLKK